MGRPEKKKTENEVIKASAAIQINGKITLLQRRAWNVLLAHAYNELPSKERHSIPVQDLMHILDYNSTNQDYLKESLKALIHCSVEWNLLEKDGPGEWGAAALLAGAKISRGICTYEYGSILREKLYNPRMYARLSLLVQNRFESKHALTLWELCVDYLGAKRDCGETPWIDINDFRRIMGVEDSHYYAALFKKLKQKVITPALDEINDISDFSVTVEYRHQGRKVTALKFKMRRVVMMLPEPVNTQAPLFPDLNDMPLLVKELSDAGLSMQDAMEIWQKGFKFVDDAARPTDSGEDADAAFMRYVREKIHLLKRLQASGKVANSTGFLLKAIKTNYANPEFAQEAKRQEAAELRKAQKAREAQKKQLEAQLEALKTAHGKALGAVYGAIAAESPEVLETALSAILAAKPILLNFYKSGLSALENYQQRAMLEAEFYPYLEAHATERIQAVKERSATELAAIEQQIAALQAI